MEVGERNLDEWSSWCSVIHKAIGQQLVTGERDSSVFWSFTTPGGHNKNSKEWPQIISPTFSLSGPQRTPSGCTIWQPDCHSFLTIEAAVQQHLHSHDPQGILLKLSAEDEIWWHYCTWGPFSAVCIQSWSSTQDLESLTWDHSGTLCIVPYGYHNTSLSQGPRWNHRIVRGTLKGHLVWLPCSEQGPLQLDQVVQSSIQLTLNVFSNGASTSHWATWSHDLPFVVKNAASKGVCGMGMRPMSPTGQVMLLGLCHSGHLKQS